MKRTDIKLVNGEDAVVVDDGKIKILKSENYNFLFQKSDGFFARWVKHKKMMVILN